MRGNEMRRRLAGAVALTAGLMLAGAPPAQAAGAATSADSYGELAARWWQWAYETGAAGAGSGLTDCSGGQRGSVWFLAGTFGTVEERTCMKALPAGKRLFFPLVNIEVRAGDCIAAGLPAGEDCTIQERRDLADGIFSDQVTGHLEIAFFGVGSYACQLSAMVDGVPVERASVPVVRVQSPPFLLEGDAEAVADGYWVLLPKLAKGHHTVQFSGAVCDIGMPPDFPPLFAPSVSYNLVVH